MGLHGGKKLHGAGGAGGGSSSATGGGTVGGSGIYYAGTVDGTAVFTSGTTLTLAGIAGAITNDAQLLYVRVVHADNTSDAYFNAVNNVTLTHSGGVVTIHGAGTVPLVTGDQIEVGINFKEIGHDIDLDAVKTIEQGAYERKWTNPEHIIDENNTADGTSTRYIFDMLDSGYIYFGLQYKLYTNNAGDTVTMTVWGTNNSAADDTADTNWVDVSVEVFGVASKSATGVANTTEDISVYDVPCVFSRVMIKIVVAAAGPANNTDVYLTRTN